MADRIPSLDGLRAVAILLVIADHSMIRWSPWPPWVPSRILSSLNTIAPDAVKLFFVLSGFLITSILLRELRKSGTISLKQFYWRRSLRIFPAMYIFISVIGIGYVIGLIQVAPESPWRIFAAVFYISDYFPLYKWPLFHTWSLSVEEQFYFLWPGVLLLCGIHRAALFPLLLIVVAIVSRTFGLSYIRFDSVCDSLAVGCLVAIWRPRLERLLRQHWPKSLPLSMLLAIPALTFPMTNLYSRHIIFSDIIGIPFFNILLGFAMLGVIMQPPAWLNTIPMVWLGRISYSLYLWQQPWVYDLRIGLLGIPGAFFCAWLSYRFIEQPVLQWRDKMIPTPMQAVAASQDRTASSRSLC